MEGVSWNEEKNKINVLDLTALYLLGKYCSFFIEKKNDAS